MLMQRGSAQGVESIGSSASLCDLHYTYPLIERLPYPRSIFSSFSFWFSWFVTHRRFDSLLFRLFGGPSRSALSQSKCSLCLIGFSRRCVHEYLVKPSDRNSAEIIRLNNESLLSDRMFPPENHHDETADLRSALNGPGIDTPSRHCCNLVSTAHGRTSCYMMFIQRLGLRFSLAPTQGSG